MLRRHLLEETDLTRCPLRAILLGTLAVAGCSLGPRFEASLPQVRDVPVVANLAPSQALARGRSFLGARQYGLAIELFKSARRDPALRTESLNGLAVAYDALGRRDIAERYFEESLASQPADERTRRNLARFYAATGQLDKKRAILSDTPVIAMAEPQAPRSDALEQAAQNDSSVTTVQKAMAIERQSPLAPLLSPMVVRAGLPTQSAPSDHARARSSETKDVLECLLDRAASAVDAPAGMRMFRLNIGEVFITAEPSGTTCRAESTENETLAAPYTSNGEYLGRVAAYLDRLNREAAAEEIALLWVATFWPQRGA